MVCTERPLFGRTPTTRVIAPPTPFTMAPKRVSSIANRTSTKPPSATSSFLSSLCSLRTLWLNLLLRSHGPGQHPSHRRRRNRLRHCPRRLPALRRRLPRRAKSQARHGHQHPQQRRHPLRHLLPEEFPQSPPLHRRQPPDV